MSITLIGMGGGSLDTVTRGGWQKILEADVVIGAKRLLESLPGEVKAEKKAAISAKDIFSIISENESRKVACIYSGDTGFYSGTTSISKLLEEENISFDIIPGISSIQLLASALKEPWQDWNLVSAHGRETSVIGEVMKGKKTFLLLDAKTTPASVGKLLKEAGLGKLQISVGERLSSENQKITTAAAEEIAEKEFDSLSVMLIDPAPAGKRNRPGIPDDAFTRGKVPMTKQEIRSNVVAKLQIEEKDTIWDVGAGTGSVTVEMALAAKGGMTYAIECNEEGIELIKENRKTFGAWNIVPVHGMAPEALKDLPAPDKVFLGGTKNNMAEILDVVNEKNDKAVVTVTAIALETIGRAVTALTDRGYELDICQIQSSNASRVGGLNLMKANNPIYIITGRKND